MILNRISEVRKLLCQNNLDALMVTNQSDIFYLSGFNTSDCVLIFTPSENILITDSRYTLIAQSVAQGYEIIECNSNQVGFIRSWLTEHGCKRVGIQDEQLTLRRYMDFSQGLSIEFCPIGQRLTFMRAVKDDNELANICAAQKIADEAFTHMLGYIKPGQTETEIALELEFTMRRMGAAKLSFDSIVASGPNSAKPHAVPEERKICCGDLLTLDFGCVVNGYCSDMTRTIGIGSLNREQLEIYEIVLEAHNRSKHALAPGVSSKSIDELARGYIASKGYGKYFGHGLGHGVGIDIHELPVLSFRSDTVLEPGNVVTIEPGIYVPELGGVRIENMCAISKEGYIDLAKSDNKLIII